MTQDKLEAILIKLSEQLKEEEEIGNLSKEEWAELRIMLKFFIKEKDILPKLVQIFRLLLGWGKLGRVLIWLVMTGAAVMVAWNELFKSGAGGP